MQFIDLKGFGAFMESRNLVAEKYRSYYASWVRRFLQSEFTPGELSGKDWVVCYLDQLARDDSVQEWQLKQAEQAVKLYPDVYLPEANGEKLPAGRSQPESGAKALPAEARQAAGDMRKLLRLRHYALRTEQTYMEWAERYFQYVAALGLAWNETGSMRAFLSHLALRKNVASSTQNQAFSSLMFLFKDTLDMEVPKVDAVRARRGKRLPDAASGKLRGAAAAPG